MHSLVYFWRKSMFLCSCTPKIVIPLICSNYFVHIESFILAFNILLKTFIPLSFSFLPLRHLKYVTSSTKVVIYSSPHQNQNPLYITFCVFHLKSITYYYFKGSLYIISFSAKLSRQFKICVVFSDVTSFK